MKCVADHIRDGRQSQQRCGCERLTYLSVVQTRGQTPRLIERWQLQQRSLSWCCRCTSPPPTCTDRPHWPRLKARAKSNVRLKYSEFKNRRTTPGSVVLTYYEAHPRCITKEEAFLHDVIAVVHVNADQCNHDAGQVHLDVSHPQRRVWALQHLLKVHTLNQRVAQVNIYQYVLYAFNQ